MDEWTGVILAGGLGTRLLPLTTNIPKPLVCVANKAMLDYAIDHLQFAGVKKIIIVLKHLADKIRDHMQVEWFEKPERLQDLDIKIPDVDSKDTADALRKVDHLIDTDKVLVSMGDIVTNLPLNRFLQYHVEKGGFATISMKTIDEPTQYGVVMLDENKKIYLFLEKPDSQTLYMSSFTQRGNLFAYTNLINTGIYAFNGEILSLLKNEPGLMDFGKNVFPYLLENNLGIFGFVEDYYWMDVGQAKPYLWANWDLLRNYAWPVLPRGEEHDELFYDEFPRHGPGCTFERPGAFGDGIVMGSNNKVKPLCVIDDNVCMGDNNQVERSTIWKDVIIGDNCKIVESIVCDGVVIEDDVTLTECVVGPGCKIMAKQHRKFEKINKGINE